MPEVTVTVRGRPYAIVCGENEEERVQRLASILDHEVESRVGRTDTVGDARAMLIASLAVLDRAQSEAESAARQVDELVHRLETLASHPSPELPPVPSVVPEKFDR